MHAFFYTDIYLLNYTFWYNKLFIIYIFVFPNYAYAYTYLSIL